MIDIAQHEQDGPVCASEIARRQNVSTGYLERILKNLVDGEILTSKKGPGGGYVLDRPAEEICLCDIVDACGEELVEVPCVCEDCGTDCPLYGECPARAVWAELREVIGGFLKRRSLAEFANLEFRTGSSQKSGLRPLRFAAGSY